MDLNVDVVCNGTGEVLKEGILLANAYLYIAKRNGKIDGEEIITEDLDEIDGGGTIQVRTIYVDLPEVDLASHAEMVKRTNAWWQYENGGGQVR